MDESRKDRNNIISYSQNAIKEGDSIGERFRVEIIRVDVISTQHMTVKV